MKARIFAIGALLLFSGILPQAMTAATTNELKADPVLKQLYAAQLQRPTTDEFVENRIRTERSRIRTAELKEINALVHPPAEPAEDNVSPGAVLEQQKALVETLRARRQAAKVDLDLLKKELTSLTDGTAPDAVELTPAQLVQAKADILARQAMLEERIAATDEILPQQEDRLNRLAAQQRSEQLVGVVRIVGVALVLIVIVLAERLVRRQLIGRIRNRNHRYLAMKLFTGFVYVTVIGWSLYQLSINYPGILTSFAILGLGITLALQSVIKDIVGWLVIIQKRLYVPGHRVTIGAHTGDVVDVTLLRTTLIETHGASPGDAARAGKMLHVPNSLVLEQPVLNFHTTSDFIETDVPVKVAYGTDLHATEEILRAIIQECAGEYAERARMQYLFRTSHVYSALEPPEPTIFIELVSGGIVFTLRFQVPIGQRRSVVSEITRRVIERFETASPKILFAE